MELDAALDGDVSEYLLRSLAADIGTFVLGYERRAALWDAVRGEVKDLLLAGAAAALLAQIEAGASFSPEACLAKAALLCVERHWRPSPSIVAALLSWDVDVTEQQMIRWLADVTPERWGAVAWEVGEAISNRGWREAAAVLGISGPPAPLGLVPSLALGFCRAGDD